MLLVESFSSTFNSGKEGSDSSLFHSSFIGGGENEHIMAILPLQIVQ